MQLTDVVEKVHRRLLSGVREQVVTLTEAYTAGSEVLYVGGGYLGAIVPGTLLSVDLEMFYVQSSTTTGALTVIPGYDGSTEANHAVGAQAVINDRFPRFDIVAAINDDLSDLAAPYNGMGQILTVSVTFNPTYMGYDLGSQFVSPTSKILEVSYKIAPPVRTYPLIRRGEYRVIRNADTVVFPSGNALVIYKSAYPGLPVQAQFLAPFSPLVNLTDDLTGVAGLPETAYDLPALGAQILLMQPREIKRNFNEAQPDPRKAPEVPPAAIMQSTNKLEQQRQKRIDAEADRISRAYPNMESW
jgi:hypothetical protein